jgi:hypothetical protein
LMTCNRDDFLKLAETVLCHSSIDILPTSRDISCASCSTPPRCRSF